MVNGTGSELPPPNCFPVPSATTWLKTVILATPALAKLSAEILDVNCVGLTNVVPSSGKPLKRTCDVLTKLLPVRVIGTAALPTLVRLGVTLASEGFGLITRNSLTAWLGQG